MKKTILVIEDELEIRKDIVRTLELSNYNALDAGNGVLGLEMIRKYKPDVIISDIMMPDLDGFGLLKSLRAEPELSSIPFLFLSAKSSRNDIREGMNLGADDYISKPYDIEELLEAIESRLKKKEMTEVKYDQRFEDLRSSLRKSLPHEIRTPLNIILGLSEFLKKNCDMTSSADIKEMLQNINDSGKRLHKLFENYLFYANLEIIASNPEELKQIQSKKTQLPEFIIKDISFHIAGINGRTDDVEMDLEGATLAISELYFIKMIDEIFDNAIKFTVRRQKIFITSRVKDGFFTLTFKDHGRGMTAEQIECIGAYLQFERKIYEQQGAGLGIAISKRIVDLHNGKFSIESSVGEYTTVVISIPCAK